MNFLVICFFLQINALGEAPNIAYSPDRLYRGQTIWDLADVPEENMDIGLWALILAKEKHPELDIPRYLARLDALAEAVLRGLPDQTDLAKVSLTQIVLYKPGFWNQKRIFAYDFDDPFGDRRGSNLVNKALDSYLGNCISLPVLFLAVMERVDPNVRIAAVAVPFHFFCRFRDGESGLVLNIETTSGQMYEGDDIPISKFNPTPQAVASGLYMRDLSKKELIAELLAVLVPRAPEPGKLEQTRRYAELALQINPKSAFGLVTLSSVYYQQGYNLFHGVRKLGRDLNPMEKKRAGHLSRLSDRYLAQAKTLGWEPPSEQDRQEYLESLKGFRAGN